ncbi:MAG: hypothetical protein WD576_00720, partial [Nitriliruptoraceae bacterium]
ASLIGGTFGVINGLAIAQGFSVPSSFLAAHPGTMTVGFIMPVAMGLAEWGLRHTHPDEPITRSGKVQVGLMAFAFLWVLGATPRLVPSSSVSRSFISSVRFRWLAAISWQFPDTN